MNTRVILLSREGDDRDRYVKEFGRLKVRADVASSFGGLHKALVSNEYNGIIIDVATRMKAAKQEKEVAAEILSVTIPTTQVKWDGQSGAIQALYPGQSKKSGTLEAFIRSECDTFTPRRIRRHKRRNIHFNLILSGDLRFHKGTVLKTITINVSKGGCFIYSTDTWQEKMLLHFVIREMEDMMPVTGEVIRGVPWGKKMIFPGIGVCFTKINNKQLDWMVRKFQL